MSLSLSPATVAAVEEELKAQDTTSEVGENWLTFDRSPVDPDITITYTYKHPWQTVVDRVWTKDQNPEAEDDALSFWNRDSTSNASSSPSPAEDFENNDSDVYYVPLERFASRASDRVYIKREMRVRIKMPLIIRRLFSVAGGEAYSSFEENCVLNTSKQNLVMELRNLDFLRFLTIRDQREFRPHPSNPSWTLFVHRGRIQATGQCGLLQSTVAKYAQKSFRTQAERAAVAFAEMLDADRDRDASADAARMRNISNSSSSSSSRSASPSSGFKED